MDSKKIRKAPGRFFAWMGLNLGSLIIKFVPEQCIYGLAKHIASLVYIIAKRQRRTAIESLTIAFGREKSTQEIEQIAKDCFSCIAKAGVEILFFMDKPRLFAERVEMAGKDNLDNALAKGRGVILVSAHFGNFPLLMAYLAVRGYKISCIMRLMRDARVERFFSKKRTAVKIKTIYNQPRAACVNNTIETLRNNELVFIPIDQNFGTGGIFVDFFGRKAATATGPIVFAQRTKAVLLPCFIIRQEHDRHKIIFEQPLNLEEGKNPQETIAINIQRLTNIIESYIRQYPAEWGWIHRRWKSKL